MQQESSWATILTDNPYSVRCHFPPTAGHGEKGWESRVVTLLRVMGVTEKKKLKGQGLLNCTQPLYAKTFKIKASQQICPNNLKAIGLSSSCLEKGYELASKSQISDPVVV